MNNKISNNNRTTQAATLANGCFWCSKAIFKRLKGIKSILPGYAGGIIENPHMTKYVLEQLNMRSQFR